MNIRIEQVAAPATPPNRQTRRRLPRGLGDARRLAAQIMLRPNGAPGASRASAQTQLLTRAQTATPTLTRRGTSTLALAVAALAIPALPATAAAATAPVGTVAAPAPLVRHHLPHGLMFPSTGRVSFQTWAASGWTLTGEDPGAGMDPRCLVIPHHHRCTPWLYHPDGQNRLAGADLTDERRPVIEALPISHVSPRSLGELGGPDSVPDLPRPAPSTDQQPDHQPEQQPDQQSDQSPTADEGARARMITTLAADGKPAQSPARHSATSSTVATAPAALPANHIVTTAKKPGATAKKPVTSTCLRAAYMAGKDHRMLAHLRPAVDAMGVIVNHRRAACAAMVDYLSQARA